MKERIIKFADLINEKDHKFWYALRPDIKEIFESHDIEELLSQFESSIEDFEKQKRPELTLMFFMALFILYDRDDNYLFLIKRTDNKEYIKYLKAGIKKYVQGKSNSFRYVHKLEFNNKNPYNFISLFSSWIPEYEIKLRGFLNIIEFFLHKDQETFFEIISVDNQNAIALTAILHPRAELDWGNLHRWLIRSQDELKQNAAVYYILNSDEQMAQAYLDKISLFLYSIPMETATNLLLNYLFTEKQPLKIVFEYFKNINSKDLIELELINRKKINLNDISTLILLSNYLTDKEILDEFIFLKFVEWLNLEANEYEWNQYKDNIINYLKHCSNLIHQLDFIESSLYVHNFDKTIRFKKYLRDIIKQNIIHEIKQAT